MTAATWPRDDKLAERLLWIDPEANTFGDARVGDLARLPRENDLLVVNDAATLPVSLMGHTREGAEIELRLVAPEPSAGRGAWRAVMFGAGDWRQRTEDRPAPPALARGDTLCFGDEASELTAVVARHLRPRLVVVRFDRTGGDFWSALYSVGRPVQYSYTRAPVPLFHVQTAYASRPWAAEMPSAGRPLTWSTLLDLKARGVGLASLTHAAGLSSTGDAELDESMPWPERYAIPEETAEAVTRASRTEGRVIAVGTTVVRALESAAVGATSG